MNKIILILDSIEKRFYIPISFLIFLMIICAFLEVISIGAVMPFILILISPEKLFEYEIFYFLKGTEPEVINLIMITSFILIVITSMCARILLLWRLSRTSFDIGVQLSNQMFRNIINQPYNFFIQNNSSDLTESLTLQNQRLIFHIIHPMFLFTSSLLIFAFITIILIVIDWKLTIISGLFFFTTYYLISKLSKKKLLSNSEIIKNENRKIFKLMQESFGGMRDTIINNTGNLYASSFLSKEKRLRSAEAVNLLFGVAPRYLIEGLGIVFIIIVAIYLKQESSSSVEMIGTIAVLALAAQRLLPVVQNIYQSYVLISGANATLISVGETLRLSKSTRFIGDKLERNKINLENSIKLVNVEYSYPESSNLSLKNINLEIFKGEKIGIVGPTGSGKTTLLDIIIGLLEPKSGKIEIDGTAITRDNYYRWFSRVSHVPQNIFLSDSTLLENIGIKSFDDISYQDVINATKISEIFDFAESLDSKFETIVGEKGIKLSGGQRQRIGIARAIYKLKDLLIMDEATSALDNLTESKIINNLKDYNPSLTIIMVAHRVSSLSICDRIIEIDNGTIKRISNYNDFVKIND